MTTHTTRRTPPASLLANPLLTEPGNGIVLGTLRALEAGEANLAAHLAPWAAEIVRWEVDESDQEAPAR